MCPCQVVRVAAAWPVRSSAVFAAFVEAPVVPGGVPGVPVGPSLGRDGVARGDFVAGGQGIPETPSATPTPLVNLLRGVRLTAVWLAGAWREGAEDGRGHRVVRKTDVGFARG